MTIAAKRSSSRRRIALPPGSVVGVAPRTTATNGERDLLRALGEARSVSILRMPRLTLSRVGAGWPCREATMALFRARLSEARTRGEL